jgi:tRNA pseudouridine38-40 synthase
MDASQRTQLTVRYDGTSFAGSQIQPARNGRPSRTVSGTLTDELETLLGRRPHLLWASRTDSGVHAEGNVCAFDGELTMPMEALIMRLNRRLAPEIQVRAGRVTSLDWHPRFSATARKYVYRVWREPSAPYDKLRYVHCQEGTWNHQAVASLAQRIEGNWDCRALSRKICEDNTACSITRFQQLELGPEVQWHVTANRFLWRMMRNLAGLLLTVAEGKVDPDTAAAVLMECRRVPAKIAPAKGLVLWEIYYA